MIKYETYIGQHQEDPRVLIVKGPKAAFVKAGKQTQNPESGIKAVIWDLDLSENILRKQWQAIDDTWKSVPEGHAPLYAYNGHPYPPIGFEPEINPAYSPLTRPLTNYMTACREIWGNKYDKNISSGFGRNFSKGEHVDPTDILAVALLNHKERPDEEGLGLAWRNANGKKLCNKLGNPMFFVKEFIHSSPDYNPDTTGTRYGLVINGH